MNAMQHIWLIAGRAMHSLPGGWYQRRLSCKPLDAGFTGRLGGYLAMRAISAKAAA